MSIVKPYTFTAGTKARAAQVNSDFDVLYSQVNTNISDIAENASDIDNLDATKANLNGSSTERFAVADAVADNEAINKQTLFKDIANSLDLISGLIITKDSSSSNTIIVDTGSCYDSTKTVPLNLTVSTSKQNSTQSASTTYYVHIVGNSTGSSIDILISTSKIDPAMPSGYTLYRCIGSYTTNSSNSIDTIISFGIPIGSSLGISVNDVFPDFSKQVNMSSGYVAPASGYIRFIIYISGNDPYIWISIDGNEVHRFSRGGDYGGGKYDSFFGAIDKGSTVTWGLTQASIDTAKFVYSNGG